MARDEGTGIVAAVAAVAAGWFLWDKLSSAASSAKKAAAAAANAVADAVSSPTATNVDAELRPAGPLRDAQLAADRAFLIKQGWTVDPETGLLRQPGAAPKTVAGARAERVAMGGKK